MTFFPGSHNKTLWSIVSGIRQPASADLVGPFIERNRIRIISGIEFFKPSSEAAGDDDSLSQALDLDQAQTSDLIATYRETEFRGTGDQFETQLATKHMQPGFLAEIWQFYLDERLYLLHCMQTILSESQNPDHLYQEMFAGFLETYDAQRNVKTSLISQLKSLSRARCPAKSPLITPVLVKSWWHSNILERLMVLQSLIHYSDSRQLDAKDFLEIASTCGCPAKVPSDGSDAEMDVLYTSMLHLQSALLIKLMDVRSPGTDQKYASN